MKAIIIVLTLIVLPSCATKKLGFSDRGEGKSSFKAVSRTFSSIETAYEEIHSDCKKEWASEFGALGGSNTSFSVEILAVDKETSFLSALCVSTTYKVSKAGKEAFY